MRPGPIVRLFFALLLTASVAAAQPDFSKDFIPSTIGPGGSTAAVFTIDNSGGGPTQGLAFSDTLPASVTIADPPNVQNTCSLSIGGSIDAPAGGDTIVLSGGQIAAGALCTISVDVTSSTPGTHTNPAVELSSSAGMSSSLPADLIVDTGRPGISKSFAPSTVALGGRSTLTITIDNSANGAGLFSLNLVDNFPPGLIVADPSNASTTCTGGPNPTLTVGADFVSFLSFNNSAPDVLAAGASCTITVDVVGTIGGTLGNVSGELATNFGSSGKASASLEVLLSNLLLDKKFTDDPVPFNSQATLEFKITNFSRDTQVTDVTFTDDLSTVSATLSYAATVDFNDCGGSVDFSNSDTLLTLTGASVAPQATCTIRVPVVVPSNQTPGAFVNTTSTISGMLSGSPVVGNAASDTLFVQPAPALSKTFLTDPVSPGDTVTLRFEIQNTSADSVASDITFSDPLPIILPTASATPGDDCCGAGSTCTFTPLFVNSSNETIPSNLTLTGGTLNGGDSCTFDLTLDVAPDAPPGIYSNVTSTVSATVDGLTYSGDSAMADLNVTAAPALGKSFTPDVIEPGGTATLEFTLTHRQSAAGDASNITFTDDLNAMLAGLTATLPVSPDPPCGAGSTLVGSAGDSLLTLSGGTLTPGESCTFSVTVNVPSDASPGFYTNTTSGVAADVDSVSTVSQAATATLQVVGFRVSKEFIDGPALPGGQIMLRFTLENLDPTFDATAIFFTDTLSAALSGLAVNTTLPLAACGGTMVSSGPSFLIFTGGAVAQGDPPCTFDLVLDVPAMADDGTYINITSIPTATMNGTTVTAPAAVASFNVDSNKILLEKSFTDDPVSPGNTVNLRFTLTNLDDVEPLSSIGFTDNLGAALSGLEATGLPIAACGGTLGSSGSPSNLSFTGGALTASEVCSFDVSLAVPAGAQAGEYTNITSEVTGLLGGGIAVTGDPARDDLEILDLLTFTKAFSGPVTAGDTLTLDFTITNPGDSLTGGIAFSDDLDALLSGLVATNLPLSDVCGAGSMLSGTGFISLTGGSLPPMGGTCSFSVDLQMPATAVGGDYLNTTSDLSAGGLTVAPPATATLTVLEADLSVVKTGPMAITVGQRLSYSIQITNNGPNVATGVVLDDPTPAGLVFEGADATCPTGFPCNLGTMNVSDSFTIFVDFNVPIDYSGASPIQNTATGSSALGDSNPSNNSSTASTTVQFDAFGPTVAAVETGGFPITECATVLSQLRVISIVFEDTASAIVGADDAANFLLLAAGADGDFSTTACGAAAGDDIVLPIHSLGLTGGGTSTVTTSLHVGNPLGLDAGLYRLLVCDTITDAVGNALDGDDNGTPGGDFNFAVFRADPFNLFRNSHFDDCPATLSPWITTVTAPSTLQTGTAGTDDFEGSPLSSSARVMQAGADASSLAQCVPVSGPLDHFLNANARFGPVTATSARLVARCEIFDGAECSGSSLGVISRETVLDQNGVWTPVQHDIAVPAGAVGALCDYAVTSASGGNDLDLYLDALFFGPDALLFVDGFEAGDISAWTTSVP